MISTVLHTFGQKISLADYINAYPDADTIDLYRPIDLLAHKLHTALGVDTQKPKTSLTTSVEVMGSGGFIDHGYYSADHRA